MPSLTIPRRSGASPVPGMRLIEGALVPDGDNVICLGADGAVRAFDTRDGSRRWLTQLKAGIEASAILAGDRLVVPTVTSLVALDTRNGRKVWEKEAVYGCDAAPAISGNRVFAAFRNEGVRAFDLDTGEMVFERKCNPSGALLVDGDLIVVGTADAQLMRLHSATGKDLWLRDIGSEPDMGPSLAAPGIVVVLAENRYLRGIATEDGRTLWERRLTTASRSESLASGAGRVFVSDARGTLRAFDAGTGKPLWNRNEGMLELGGPCVTAKHILWADNGGRDLPPRGCREPGVAQASLRPRVFPARGGERPRLRAQRGLPRSLGRPIDRAQLSSQFIAGAYSR